MENLPKDLLNSGKPDNIATWSFKLLTFGGFILAAFAALAQISDSQHFLSIFKFDYIKSYVILINFSFALAIYFLGEPIHNGWDEGEIKRAIKKSPYFLQIKNGEVTLDHAIRDLKAYFSKYWIYLWGTWTLLYLILLIKNISIMFLGNSNTITPASLIFTLIENSLNYASSYFLITLNLILIHKSIGKEQKKEENYSYHRNKNKIKFFLRGLILAEIAGYLCIFMRFSSYSSAPHMIIITDYTSFKVYIDQVTWVFEIINGLIGSVSLALFVGRLIGNPTTVLKNKNTWHIPLLYLYCAIQPFFMIISDEKYAIVVIFLLIIALAGKYYLYRSVMRLFDTKKILFHFIETITLTESINEKLIIFQNIWESKETQKKLSSADSDSETLIK